MDFEQQRAIRPLADRVHVGALSRGSRSALSAWREPFKVGDQANTPPVPWIYAPHLARGYVSVLHAQPGVGKSALVVTEALAVATGRPLLGLTPAERSAVWYVSLEDPQDQTTARVEAAMQHHAITDNEIGGRLFLSRPPGGFELARSTGRGTLVNAALADTLAEFILANNVGVLCGFRRCRHPIPN
jgi:hypothetical protein